MSFILDHGHYEWELVQGNTTYDKTNFSTGTLSEAVFQQFTIGSVAARQLNLTMWNCPLNTTDPIQLVCKAVASDGTVTTIQKGVYFIDTIDTSPYSEYCEVTAFDAMLKTETVYMKSGVYTPKTALQLVQEIAGDIGVQVEADTVTYITSKNFNFTEVPKIGTKDGTTDREILSVIGIWYGGNWIINDANELELLLADGAMYGVTLLTVGSDGLFYSLPIAYAEDGVMVVENDAQGLMNTMDFADVTDTTVLYYFDVQGRSCIGTLAEIQAEGESDLAVEVGDEVVDFDISPIEIIKRIEIEKDNNTIYRCPEGLTDEEWDALGGRCISVTMPLMASQEVANRLYKQLYGLSYLPYEASGAYFDPDTRLGRVLHIKDRLVPLFNRTLTIDQLGESNCVIEAEQRLQSFYPYLDPVVRTMQRNISENTTSLTIVEGQIQAEVTRATGAEGQLSSRITQTADAITAEVSRATGAEGTLSSRITQNADNITAEVNRATGAEGQLGSTITQTASAIRGELTDYENEVATYIQFDANGLTLGKSDSQFRTIIDNTQVYFTGSDGQRAAGINGTVFDSQRLEAAEYVSVGNWKWYTDPTDNTFNLVYGV